MVFKFHDDPTVSEPGIVVLQGPIWVYAGKKEIFRGRRRENEFERKREPRVLEFSIPIINVD